MSLFEITQAMDNDPSVSIEISQLKKYKRSLITLYGEDAILMVTAVYNAFGYGRISYLRSFVEDIDAFVDGRRPLFTEEEAQHERELIAFQSILLKDL